jgi:hypothetical protein
MTRYGKRPLYARGIRPLKTRRGRQQKRVLSLALAGIATFTFLLAVRVVILATTGHHQHFRASTIGVVAFALIVIGISLYKAAIRTWRAANRIEA